MGSTTNPQDGLNCPNCGTKSNTSGGGWKDDSDGVQLLNCDNEGCSVDRFWGEDFV